MAMRIRKKAFPAKARRIGNWLAFSVLAVGTLFGVDIYTALSHLVDFIVHQGARFIEIMKSLRA
jgi:hypothetical protein